MTGAEPGWTLDTAIPAEPVHTFSPHLRSHSVFTPGLDFTMTAMVSKFWNDGISSSLA